MEELKQLAQLRMISDEQRIHIQQLEIKLSETTEYQALAEAKEALKEFEESTNEVICAIKDSNLSVITGKIQGMNEEQRAAAFDEFKNTLTNGISLRVNHSLEYDELEAMKWCEENAKTALKTVLDKKSFEALAKATDIPFVNKIDVPTITISSDLSEYLE